MKKAPIAQKKPIIRSHHGYDFVDNYEWLRDKESPETLAYLEAENEYTEKETAHLETLRENIFQEIKSRVQETDMSVPTRSGKYWYFSRTTEGKNYGSLCRVPVVEDTWIPPEIQPGVPFENEELLLDLDEMAQGKEFFSLGTVSLLKDSPFLAYSLDTKGDERYTLYIKNVETGEHLPEEITMIAGDAVWATADYIFYERVDEAWRPYQIWRHKIGTPVEDDVLVYEEKDERFWAGVTSAMAGRYIFIVLSSKTTSETWFLDTEVDPAGEFQCIKPRETGVEYAVDPVIIAGQEALLFMHNAHGLNFELAYAPFPTKGEYLDFETAEVLVKHRDDSRIEGVFCAQDFWALGYRKGGIGRVAIMKLDPEKGVTHFEDLEWEDELYTCGIGGNGQWDSPVLRLSYGSFTKPATLYQIDMRTGERIVLKEHKILGPYDPEDYTAYRRWAIAEDGTRIPLSIIHRSDLDMSKPHPTLLYGYGSYESCMDPGFSIARLSMLDRGIVFVIAHIRGGGEMGRMWYEEGKLLKKKNTFTDFIAAADYLIEQGISTPESLVASGGSAGGLLVGAVANMAPDRFKAIVAAVPFVDALTSILMPELPLTVLEWEEWGDPLHNKEVYEYMAEYSPYDNVSAQKYPNILALTSFNDTRVLYVEPAKWIARLRDTATGGSFLLKTEMSAGHGGVSGRYDSWRETAFEYAWAINQMTGLEK